MRDIGLESSYISDVHLIIVYMILKTANHQVAVLQNHLTHMVIR